MNKALLSSDCMDWCTPQDFFDTLDREFHFVLDAAATEKSKKCARCFTPETDGLSQSWNVGGAVFCNPPYGRQIGAWVEKAYTEAQRGGVRRCFTYPGADGYKILPRIHLWESGNPLYSRAFEIHRRRGQREAIRAVSVNACHLQGERGAA